MRNAQRSRLFVLGWPVALDGYEWRETQALQDPGHEKLCSGPKRLYLQYKRDRGPERLYDPLQDAPALFLNFAALPATLDAYLAFACAYGWLGIPTHLKPVSVGLVPIGEPASAWRSAHREIAHAIEIWKSGKNPKQLEAILNEQLIGRVSPQLRWHHESKQSKLHFVPENLLGAMWLQLATAIDRGLEYRQCSTCSKWFEVARLERGQERAYCSNACRSRAYRKRKQTKKRRQNHAKR